MLMLLIRCSLERIWESCLRTDKRHLLSLMYFQWRRFYDYSKRTFDGFDGRASKTWNIISSDSHVEECLIVHCAGKLRSTAGERGQLFLSNLPFPRKGKWGAREREKTSALFHITSSATCHQRGKFLLYAMRFNETFLDTSSFPSALRLKRIKHISFSLSHFYWWRGEVSE